MKSTVRLAATDEDIARCWPVLRELRPKFTDAGGLIAQVRRQQSSSGYRLAFIEIGGRVVACAGFRIAEYLFWGRMLYVDDLVTLETERSKGHGDCLMDWLVDQAKTEGCDEFHLDSGTQRHAAHRFYFRKRMAISSYHFSRSLK